MISLNDLAARCQKGTASLDELRTHGELEIQITREVQRLFDDVPYSIETIEDDDFSSVVMYSEDIEATISRSIRDSLQAWDNTHGRPYVALFNVVFRADLIDLARDYKREWQRGKLIRQRDEILREVYYARDPEYSVIPEEFLQTLTDKQRLLMDTMMKLYEIGASPTVEAAAGSIGVTSRTIRNWYAKWRKDSLLLATRNRDLSRDSDIIPPASEYGSKRKMPKGRRLSDTSITHGRISDPTPHQASKQIAEKLEGSFPLLPKG